MERMELPGYEMLNQIGVGGMATIWKAKQLSLNRIVAIKILSKDSLPNRAALDQFRQEAHAAAQLNIPGIVQVYDAGEVHGAAYIVMEYVEGSSVGDMIQKRRMGEEEALRIVGDVGRALGLAWEKQRLVHCDIKPDNIMVASDGTVKVADFGLARMMGARAGDGDSETVFGTPNYTSPEQVEGVNDIDCRSDIYEMGATLYHMVTGRLPFAGSPGSSAMERQITDTIADPMEMDPNVSVGMAWLIEKMMVKDREYRSPSWSSVLADIDAIRKAGMPLGPLPDEGLSTVRRSVARATAPTPRVRAAVSATARRKVVVRREQLEQAQETATEQSNIIDTGRAIRMLIILATMTVCVYGGVGWLATRVPLTSAKIAPVVQEAIQSPEPDITQPENKTWSSTDADMKRAPTQREFSKSTSTWRDPEFVRAAELFNSSLATYNNYQKTRAKPEDLKKVEADCREAIRLFESCKKRAPAGTDIQLYITQCYGLISYVRHSTVIKSTDRM